MRPYFFGSARPSLVLFDGDSHTAETVPGAGHGYPSKCLPSLRAPIRLVNIGVSGSSGFHDGYAVQTDLPKRIASLLIGTNNLIAHASAATVLSIITTRITLLQGAGYTVVCVT